MRLDDCEVLDVYSEPGALNYRLRHRRTGSPVSIHVLPEPEQSVPGLGKMLNRLPPGARARILDHGKEGSLTWFLTEGLPGGEGFLSWLNRATTSGVDSDGGQSLRRIFEQASALPAPERAAHVLRECGHNSAMADRVLAMLRAVEEADSFLEVPAAKQVVADLEAAPPVLDTRPAEEPEFAAGTCVGGRYVIEGMVGRGGFGIIYSARDRQVHDRLVVLKVRRGDPGPMGHELVMRFRREVASLARITHPSVVGVLDVGRTERGTPYFVMQYVPGQTLRQKLLAEGPFPLPRIANIVRQISHALTVTHKEGICHRDLKPENVMLQDLGDGEELAIIIDFGIATMKESEHGKTLLTRAIGTRAYMPPEQHEGRPSPASDTFALGVMTWEMIAGELPGKSRRDARLTRCRGSVRKKVEASILKAMSPDYRLRHARTRDFGDEIWSALQPTSRRRRDRVIDAALAAAAGICVGLAWLVLHQRAAPPPAASGIGYYYNVRETPRGYRLHLSAPHAGTFYVLQETRPGRFKILLPGLSYFTPEVRYLDVRSVDFPSGRDWLPVQAGAPQPVLWVLWARERVESVEALARALRALPAGAVDAGLEAPSIKSMVERFRKTGGGQISEKLAVQLLPLPSD